MSQRAILRSISPGGEAGVLLVLLVVRRDLRLTKTCWRHICSDHRPPTRKHDEAHSAVAKPSSLLVSRGAIDLLRRQNNAGARYCDAHVELDQLPCHSDDYQLDARSHHHSPTPGIMRGVPALDTLHQVRQRLRDDRRYRNTLAGVRRCHSKVDVRQRRTAAERDNRMRTLGCPGNNHGEHPYRQGHRNRGFRLHGRYRRAAAVGAAIPAAAHCNDIQPGHSQLEERNRHTELQECLRCGC